MAHTRKLAITIDQGDKYTEWTALGNDTTNISESTEYGITSEYKMVEFDKANGAANTKLAAVYLTNGIKAGAAHFMDTLDPYDILCWEVYCSALTNVDYTFVRLGTDASNYTEYRYADTALTGGIPEIAAVSFSTVSAIAGTGMKLDNMSYLLMGVAFDAETNALADIRMGNVHAYKVFNTR